MLRFERAELACGSARACLRSNHQRSSASSYERSWSGRIVRHATSALELSLLVALLAFGVAVFLPFAPLHAQLARAIKGRVVDDGGRPIVGARVELSPGSRVTVSDDNGSFMFLNVSPTSYILGVRRIGYQAQSTSVDVAARDATPTIVLRSIPQILDSIRIRERSSGLRYSATVLDEAGLPVAGVAVMVAGIDNDIRTDSTGRFIVPKSVRGTLMIRMRKIGYGAYFGTLRMLADREDTLRMARLAQNLAPVQVLDASGFGRDTFVFKDLDERMRWRNHQSGVISREELDQQGRVSLCTAVRSTPTGARYGFRCSGFACVILNGEHRTLLPPSSLYADQVESVEYYPPGSDWSGTAFSRDCPDTRRSDVLVIWLRKDQPRTP